MGRKPTIVDLFCGCGGFGLGGHMAGYSTVWAADIDPILASSYVLNFPGIEYKRWDLSAVPDSHLAAACGNQKIDVVIGGPPCQGFSNIGRRQKDDPRNSLISHFFRSVAAIKPRAFVMENVPGLLSERNEEILGAGLDLVEGKYTVLPPMLLTASQFGAATNRTRAVIIGFDADEIQPVNQSDFTSIASNNQAVIVADAISDLPHPIRMSSDKSAWGWARYNADIDGDLSEYAKELRSLPSKGLGAGEAVEMLKQCKVSGNFRTAHGSESVKRFNSTNPGSVETVSRYPRLKLDGMCPTLRAGTGPDQGSYQSVRPIHPTRPRVITVREAARLQGFPDWFSFHPTKWHSFRMIGNSVCPIFAKAIMSVLYNKLNEDMEASERAA